MYNVGCSKPCFGLFLANVRGLAEVPLAHPDSDLIVGRSSVPEPIRCPLLKKPPIPRTTTMAAKSAAYSTSTARMPHLRAYSCAAYSD